jgi:uncharacterized protein (TIGR04145 family)
MKKKFFRTILAVLLILTMPVPVYADYGSIRIDGYYDDWEDKPHAEVYNGKRPPDGKINYVSLFRAEDSIYVHIKFAEKNNQGMKNMVIDISTNLGNESYWVGGDLFSGQESDSLLLEQNSEGSTGSVNEQSAGSDSSSAESSSADQDTGAGENPPAGETAEPDRQETPPVSETAEPDRQETPPGDEVVSQGGVEVPEEVLPEVKPESYGTRSFTIYQNSDPVGEGYFTSGADDQGEAEFRIPLTTISNETDGISDISMRIKKVGKQSIICVGADTGPYIGVALGAAIALASFAGYTYRRKKLCLKKR